MRQTPKVGASIWRVIFFILILQITPIYGPRDKYYIQLTYGLLYCTVNQLNIKIMENYLADLIERDLLRLKDEVKNFKEDYNLWHKTDGISNSAGTLVLHLTGSLNFCVGNKIGNTGYVRNRELEFSATDLPRQELIDGIDNLIEVIKNSLNNISEQKLEETYPLEIHGKKSTAWYLIYFYGHLNYHLGQVNYLRRMLE